MNTLGASVEIGYWLLLAAPDTFTASRMVLRCSTLPCEHSATAEPREERAYYRPNGGRTAEGRVRRVEPPEDDAGQRTHSDVPGRSRTPTFPPSSVRKGHGSYETALR